MTINTAQLLRQFASRPQGRIILVDCTQQILSVLQNDTVLGEWTISTAANGLGNQENSFMTPTGMHQIAEKIGADAPLGMIFKGRQPTGEIANIITDDLAGEHDLITTRILWLEGLEPGINQGEGFDSHARYIYIHGTPEEGRLGQAVSQGCIRMANRDILELFDLVEPGTLVYIAE